MDGSRGRMGTNDNYRDDNQLLDSQHNHMDSHLVVRNLMGRDMGMDKFLDSMSSRDERREICELETSSSLDKHTWMIQHHYRAVTEIAVLPLHLQTFASLFVRALCQATSIKFHEVELLQVDMAYLYCRNTGHSADST